MYGSRVGPFQISLKLHIMFFNLLWFVGNRLFRLSVLCVCTRASSMGFVSVLKLNFHIEYWFNGNKYTHAHTQRWRKQRGKKPTEIRKNVMIVLEIKGDLMTPFYVAITEVIKS